MQVPQADKNIRRVGVEEEFIKFRPSPNFKNMKKFLKSRSDYTETTSLAGASHSPMGVEALVASGGVSCQNGDSGGERREAKPAVVQPPLPPYPPPPDSPPRLHIVIKKEKVDDDTAAHPSEPDPAPAEEPAADRPGDRPKKTMCKEFIRGDCKRTACKFAHEIDVTQLKGVFTFCWNYQNAVCTFPNCRFVHATVFEEAEFYRTGALPPHARSHFKKAPPPPPPTEDTLQSTVNLPAPSAGGMPRVDKPLPVISCVPAAAIEARAAAAAAAEDASRASALKRTWNEVPDFDAPPPPPPTATRALSADSKKCKQCEIREFSDQYMKDMIENLTHSRDEVEKKIMHLNVKTSKLTKVLTVVLSPNTTIGNKTPLSAVTYGIVTQERIKILLEQLNTVVGNNRLPAPTNEENMETNLVGLMAKMLCRPVELAHAEETSRDT